MALKRTNRSAALERPMTSDGATLVDRTAQLEQVVDRYLSFYDHAPLGFATLNDQGVLLELNIAASELLGVQRERAIGKPLLCYVDRRDGKLLASHLLRMTGGTCMTELRLRGRGEPIPSQLFSKRTWIPSAEIANYHTVIIDIRARHRAERELRSSERRYREIVETANEGICIVDEHNIIVFANRQMAKLAGTTVESLVGRSAYELLAPEDRHAAQQEFERPEYRNSGQSEERLCRLDGQPLWTSVSTTARYDEQGRFTGMLRMYTDAGARHQLGEARELVMRQLIAAQEQERQRIARELHDQMGQHIVALSLGVSRLGGLCREVPAAVAILDELKQTADRLGHDVHRLALELRPSALDHLGLGVALTNYAEEVARLAQVEVDVHCDDLRPLNPDVAIQTGIYRIAQEALTNVIKHARATRVSVILEARGDMLTLIVEDDGVGFTRVAPGVTDPARLGLAGMQERAGLIGGTLTFESTPGRGTTIYLRVRFPEAKRNPHEETTAAAR